VKLERRGQVVCDGGNVVVECNSAKGEILIPPAPLPDPLHILAASGRVWWIQRGLLGYRGTVFAPDDVTPSVCTLWERSYIGALVMLALKWQGLEESRREGQS
jgi:hypothetical protein